MEAVRGPPDDQTFLPALQRHRAQETREPEVVVSVNVRDEHLLDGESDAKPHHLALRALAAVEKEELTGSMHGEARYITSYRRA
jgi:hypothetical protein